MRVPQIGSGTDLNPFRPDLPDGFTGGATLTEDGDYEVTLAPQVVADRIVAIEAEVQGIKERAATEAGNVLATAQDIGKAVAGIPE